MPTVGSMREMGEPLRHMPSQRRELGEPSRMGLGRLVMGGVRLRGIHLRPGVLAVCAPVVGLVLLVSVPWPAAPGYLLFGWWALLACAVDGAERRLPNRLTLGLAVASPVLLTGAAVVCERPDRALRMLAGAAALMGIYLALHLANPAGMGFGDVKLAVSVGTVLAWAGWHAWWAGALLGPLIGAVAGALLLVRRSRASPARDPVTVPFGPPMVAGAVAGLAVVGAA